MSDERRDPEQFHPGIAAVVGNRRNADGPYWSVHILYDFRWFICGPAEDFPSHDAALAYIEGLNGMLLVSTDTLYAEDARREALLRSLLVGERDAVTFTIGAMPQ